MAPVVPNPDRIRPFPDAAAFESWLSRHHACETEIWIKMFKNGSGVPTISAAEGIEVALCWGWIDGIRKRFDDLAFLQRFSPRRPKSVWSQVNRDIVGRLVADGRMTEHGLRHVEAAKADGRWDAAYATTMEPPPDLAAAIAADPAARLTYDGLSAQNRFALIFRIINLKTPSSRAKRIATFVAMLARGETIHPQRRGPMP